MSTEWDTFPTAHISRDATLIRIHSVHPTAERSHPAWFDRSEHGRFNPPPGTEPAFGTNYSSLDERGAYLETLARDPHRQPDLSGQLMSRMKPVEDLRLADLTDPAAYGQFGITLNSSTDQDLLATQDLAAQLHAAGFDGAMYWSRHDPSAQIKSVALFGEAGLQADRFREIETGPVPPRVAIAASTSHHVQLARPGPTPEHQVSQPGIAWASGQLREAGVDHVVVGDAAAAVHSRGLIGASSIDIVIREGSGEMTRAVSAIESRPHGQSRVTPGGMDTRLPWGAATVPTEHGKVNLMSTDGLRTFDELRREGHTVDGTSVPVAHIDDVAFARVSHPRLSAEPKTQEVMAFRNLVQRDPLTTGIAPQGKTL